MAFQTGYFVYDTDTLEILTQVLTSGVPPELSGIFTGQNLDVSGQITEFQETVFIEEEITIETIRSARNGELLATDWTQLPDVPINNQDRNKFRQYRQFLRDIPQIFSEPSGVAFPIRPDYTPEFQFGTGLVEGQTVESGVPWIDESGVSGTLIQEITSSGEGSGVSPYLVTGNISGQIVYVDYDNNPYDKDLIYGEFQSGISGSGTYYYDEFIA